MKYKPTEDALRIRSIKDVDLRRQALRVWCLQNDYPFRLPLAYTHAKRLARVLGVPPEEIRRWARIPISRRSTFTYLIYCTETHRTKIGKTTNVRKRFRTLESASPTVLKLLGWWIGDKEEQLHEAHTSLLYRGEWYEIPAKDIEALTEDPDFHTPKWEDYYSPRGQLTGELLLSEKDGHRPEVG